MLGMLRSCGACLVHQGVSKITEGDIFTALESIQAEQLDYSVDVNQSDELCVL